MALPGRHIKHIVISQNKPRCMQSLVQVGKDGWCSIEYPPLDVARVAQNALCIVHCALDTDPTVTRSRFQCPIHSRYLQQYLKHCSLVMCSGDVFTRACYTCYILCMHLLLFDVYNLTRVVHSAYQTVPYFKSAALRLLKCSVHRCCC